MTRFAMPDKSTIVSRHLIMDRDLNPWGNLFGGRVLAWIDEDTFLFVVDQTGCQDFVTRAIDNATFSSPANRGESLEIHCQIGKIGRSSITVRSTARVHELTGHSWREVISCDITFVALRDGKPYPFFDSDRYKEWVAYRFGDSHPSP